jgi:cation diffusion facilitator CzcD-associated flavoprotein CzcO
MQNNNFDVVIIGAGISGIGLAYWLQKKCPGKTFAVLEAKETLGGTWSLFQYPGVRSDSDMFTFGYRFKPWTNPQSISSGKDILQYLQDTVRENGLGDYIRYRHRLSAADWSETSRTWTLQVDTPEGGVAMSCRFLNICTGYYNHQEAHRPTFKGEAHFKGPIITPQFWPQELDYQGRRIVVVGSGATAITLVPSLVKGGAGRVTMLQRSPTYVMKLTNSNALFVGLKQILPVNWAYRLTRWGYILLQMVSFRFSKIFPKAMKALIMRLAASQLPDGFPVAKHFNPTYNPWDERLCVAPDGDLFEVIKTGKATVVTDTISHFTDQGIALTSGDFLPADLIVLATGLKLQLLGNVAISVNKQAVRFHESLIYKGMMVSGIPNFIYAFGYTNASWTLKVDLTANYLCRLLQHMDRKNYEVVVPQSQSPASSTDFLNLRSGYIERSRHLLPKQGRKRPWRVYQSYLVDMLATRWGRVEDRELKFK